MSYSPTARGLRELELGSISEQLYEEKKEREKNMEMKKMFGNLEFGPVDNYHLSHLGIALKNAAGEIVSYDKQKNEIVNVDLIDFDAKGMIYAMFMLVMLSVIQMAMQYLLFLQMVAFM